MSTFASTLEEFRSAVAGPAAAVPLARAALLVARSEYADLDVQAYERQLRELTDRLEARIHPSADIASQLREVQRLLFTEHDFHGNVGDYSDPRNLYLNDVIDRRVGIPVTLAIVYVTVCRGAGIDARIVGLTGHVIARVEGPLGPVLVDPFHRGRELSEEDCRRLVRNVYGRRTPFREHFLDPITPRQVIQRLIHNLKAGFLQRGDELRAGRTIELLLAMYPWDLDELRDRGMLRERVGDYAAALADLEQYLRFRASARDVQTVSEAVRSLRRQIGSPER